VDKYFTPIDAKMQAAHQALLKDYSEIRAGRITPAYVDGVVVEAYGQRNPLKDVATISAPQAKVLVVEPWDKNLLKEVERAILKANIGVTPTNDGQRVRLVFPDLTLEERKKMVARISQLTEKFREEIRSVRRDVRDDIKAQERPRNSPRMSSIGLRKSSTSSQRSMSQRSTKPSKPRRRRSCLCRDA